MENQGRVSGYGRRSFEFGKFKFDNGSRPSKEVHKVWCSGIVNRANLLCLAYLFFPFCSLSKWS